MMPAMVMAPSPQHAFDDKLRQSIKAMKGPEKDE